MQVRDALLSLLVASLVAAPAAGQLEQFSGTELIVPVFAKASGAHGAFFATSLTVDSDFPPPIDLVIRLYPRGSGPRQIDVVATRLPLTWSVADYGGLDGESGWLTVTAGRPVRVRASTAGAVIHGVPPTAAISAAERTTLGSAMGAFSDVPRVRFNFGVAEVGGSPATVAACVTGAYTRGWGPTLDSGTFRGCRDLVLEPHASLQVNSLEGFEGLLPPKTDVVRAELTLELTRGSGRVVAWGTTVDDTNEARAHASAPTGGLSAALGTVPSTLLLTKTGSGSGSIRLLSGEVLCAGGCQAIALASPANPTAILVAEPAEDSLFAGWSGCDENIGRECTLTNVSTRRVSASLPLSLVTLDVFGFLDATVTAGSFSTRCQGPVRRCAVPVVPGNPVTIGASVWTGVSPTGAAGFTGPGCTSGGCALATAPDPTEVGVELRRAEGRHIVYLGAYPSSIRHGESATLLVRTSGCNATEHFGPGPAVTQLLPGVFSVTPAETTEYEYDCYYNLPGSTRPDLERAYVTIEVAGP